MCSLELSRPAAWCLRLLLALALLLTHGSAAAQGIPPVPKDYNFAQDFGGLLHEPDISRIGAAQRKAWTEHGVPIVVVTIASMKVYGHQGAIEPFATEWFNAWRIGSTDSQGGANNGILLLVSVGDRKARIELGADWGRGWDDHAQRIMDSTIIPEFKRGNYSGGIAAGVEELGKMAAEGPQASPPARTLSDNVQQFVKSPEPVSPMTPFPAIISIGMLVLGLVLIFSAFFAEGSTRKFLLIAGVGLIVAALAFWAIVFVLALIGKARSNSSGGGGFSSSGGFGGGFSGGGGASGSW